MSELTTNELSEALNDPIEPFSVLHTKYFKVICLASNFEILVVMTTAQIPALLEFRLLNDLQMLELSKDRNKLRWKIPEYFGQPPEPRESHSAVAFSDHKGSKILGPML